MNLNALVAALKSAQPAVRRNAARILGMVEETRALDAIRARYGAEADSATRPILAWAGKRLFEAQQRGYSTIDEIFRRFKLDRELEHLHEKDEAEALKRLQHKLDMQTLSDQSSAKSGLVVGASIAFGIGMPTAGLVGSNLGESDRVQGSTSRVPPTCPSDANVAVWLQRLRQSDDALTRERAAVELRALNNPAALPDLANAFLDDPAPQVCELAEQAGKALYLGAIYWEMSQDGSIDEEFQRRADAAGRPASKKKPGSGSAPHSPEDISALLRKAEASRSRRKKK
ncbi:MAG: HEAT repeat domain-containing protein [Anaerolineae bacterium]|nr:HEAT repeat domain-containing protein [Anaerolineae bacterium]